LLLAHSSLSSPFSHLLPSFSAAALLQSSQPTPQQLSINPQRSRGIFIVFIRAIDILMLVVSGRVIVGRSSIAQAAPAKG
jgi:hypothetical protein